MIRIKRTGGAEPLEFEVLVQEGAGESRHHVTMTQETFSRLMVAFPVRLPFHQPA